MASLDSLPADQRAVLQLVLQRGRSYEDIAKLLSIDRAAVRQRALAALDALGPRTGLPDDRRAMITDYLLGQLPPDERDQVRGRLAQSPGERGWARVLASELEPLAEGSLPEIPVDGESDYERSPAFAPSPAPASEPPTTTGPPAAAGAAEGGAGGGEPPGQRPDGGLSSSRRGGLILIGGVVAVVVAVVLVLILSGGKSNSNHSASTAASASHTASTASASSTTSSTAARVVAQINLTPRAAGSKAAGIAEVLKEGANNGIAIVAQHVPPNTTKPPNAYAVWLYNSPTDAKILGFVNPGVGQNGRLSTAGGLPTNASHFKQLVVTVETQANPKTPGTILLQGTLTGIS
jgi:hypothetical protein